MISAAFPHQKQRRRVLGSEMAYVEVGEGEAMVLEHNLFVEKMLPRSILRGLTEGEMAHYRRPFAEPGEGRRPTLTWPRQVPLDGGPADVAKIMSAYAQWLTTSSVPKLFVN